MNKIAIIERMSMLSTLALATLENAIAEPNVPYDTKVKAATALLEHLREVIIKEGTNGQ